MTIILDLRQYIFLKNKSEVFQTFQAYKAYAENHTNYTIKTLRSDNGGEFISNEFNNFFIKNGILRQFIPYTPEQNGVSERKNRTLIECARCMLHTSNLPKKIWADAVATACYIQNRIPSKAIVALTTPLTLWCGKSTTLSHFKIFGCTAYAHIPDEHRQKLDIKTNKCIFVGYGEVQGNKGYLLYDQYKRQYLVSRNVVFDEDSLLKGIFHPQTQPIQNLHNNDLHNISDDLVETQIEELLLPNIPPQPQPPNNTLGPSIQTVIPSLSSNAPLFSNISDIPSELQRRQIFSDLLSASEIPLPDNDDLSGEDISSDPILLLKSLSPIQPRRSNRTTKGQLPYKYHDHVLFTTHLSTLPDLDEPATITEALNGENARQWKEALDSEYNSLLKNNTWVLEDLPLDRSLISCKWILKRKYNAHGIITRYKARLVARGFSQEKRN